MKLKSFGCSFIFGTDLTDRRGAGWASKVSWPALIAKELGREYHCHAWPGIGNMQIAHRILAEAEHAHDDVFVIGWSWVDRYDYINPVNNDWNTLRPEGDDKSTQYYYKNFHSQYYDKLLSLTAINNVVNTLKEKNIPYIMTYMDEILFETEWHCDPVIKQLQQRIRPEMITFDNSTFLTWAKEKGFPISETLHPLEQAHEEAFKLLCRQNIIDRLRHA